MSVHVAPFGTSWVRNSLGFGTAHEQVAMMPRNVSESLMSHGQIYEHLTLLCLAITHQPHKFENDDREDMLRAVNDLKLWMATHPLAHQDEIDAKRKEFDEVVHPVIWKVYKAGGGDADTEYAGRGFDQCCVELVLATIICGDDAPPLLHTPPGLGRWSGQCWSTPPGLGRWSGQ